MYALMNIIVKVIIEIEPVLEAELKTDINDEYRRDLQLALHHMLMLSSVCARLRRRG